LGRVFAIFLIAIVARIYWTEAVFHAEICVLRKFRAQGCTGGFSGFWRAQRFIVGIFSQQAVDSGFVLSHNRGLRSKKARNSA
jgi:hypothetical protein